MLKSLIYVSVHQLGPEVLTGQLADIVTVAKRKNALVNVSGVLIATDRYFSQVLQGPSAGVDGLMLSINADQRHSAITIIEDTPIDRRSCPDWKLAYVGKDGYINRQIFPLINVPRGQSWTHDRLRMIRVMREFCRR
jgi:hypothetical protein